MASERLRDYEHLLVVADALGSEAFLKRDQLVFFRLFVKSSSWLTGTSRLRSRVWDGPFLATSRLDSG